MTRENEMERSDIRVLAAYTNEIWYEIDGEQHRCDSDEEPMLFVNLRGLYDGHERAKENIRALHRGEAGR